MSGIQMVKTSPYSKWLSIQMDKLRWHPNIPNHLNTQAIAKRPVLE